MAEIISLGASDTLGNSGVNGKVGVGTTSPNTELSVKQSGNTSSNGITLESTGGQKAVLWKQSNAEGALVLRNGSTDTLAVGINKVGIGTLAPSAGLHIESEGDQLRISKNTGFGIIKADSSGVLTLNSSANRIEVASGDNFTVPNGSVGIGTTGPAHKLDVQGESLRLKNPSGSASMYIDGSAGTNSVLYLQENAANRWAIYSDGLAGTDDLRIDRLTGSQTNAVAIQQATGNVGIGTTNPSQAKLEVNGTGYFSDNVALASGKTVDGVDVSEIKLNQMPGAASGDIDCNGHKVTSVADPTNPQDAATKNYVDGSGANLWAHNTAPALDVTYLANSTDTVGIGTSDTSPWGAKLVVVGFVNITTGLGIGDGGNISTDNVRARDGDGLSLTDNIGTPTNGIFIKTAGNVGIGTTNPLRDLHVVGDGTYSATFMSGRVGVGTTAPSDLLEVDSSGYTRSKYKSSDGSAGVTQTIDVDKEDVGGGGYRLVFKNGILTSVTDI